MAIITVSRPYGSGGTLFARNLSEKMGYKYIDKNYCDLTGSDVQKCLEIFESDEEASPLLLERVSELMSNRSFYKVNLLATIYSMALQDDAVIVGRGSNIILEGVPHVLSVQIVGELSDRVRAIADLKDISYDEALKLINKYDAEKRKFIEYYFDKDIFDPTLYHFVVNLSLVPLDNAISTIAGYAAAYCNKQSRQAAERILKNRLIEKKAEILLFGLGMTQTGKIVFTMDDDGTLTAKGMVRGDGEKNKLLEALRRLHGVREVKDSLKTGILSRSAY